MDFVYFVCALNFGWDKETVDKQDAEYLLSLLYQLARYYEAISGKATSGGEAKGWDKI